MKQFQTSYQSEAAFRTVVIRWQEYMTKRGTKGLIHIFAQYTGNENLRNELISITHILDEELPSVNYAGAAAAGPVFDGYVSEENIVVALTEFEKDDTEAVCAVFPTGEKDISRLPADITGFTDKVKNLQGIEIMATSEQTTVMQICQALNQIDPDVKIFGGLAVSDNEHTSYIFAKGTGLCRNACVLTGFSGSQLHISTDRITGWKPIGASMEATKAEGNVLYELDHEPAYNVYYKYLRIPNDDNIFYNALEFPFEVTSPSGASFLRHAKSCSADGAITMSTDVPQGSRVRITYGDPKTIVQSVKEECDKAKLFQPEVIAIFDCYGRKLFWGKSASNDTRPFYHVADTYGFCTLGEIMGKDGEVTLHNLSVIVACMREGDIIAKRNEDVIPDNKKEVMSLVSRLANFIDAATGDLMQANEQLKIMSITDRLTGLLNRGEIQKRIDEAAAEAEINKNHLSLIMGDIDDFKQVNDNYGHYAGDEVLQIVSGIFRQYVNDYGIDVGRWGGEEFMFLLEGKSLEETEKIAEQLRQTVAGLQFDNIRPVTMSFGVTTLKDTDSRDAFTIRVDDALYAAKHNGKNQVVVF